MSDPIICVHCRQSCVGRFEITRFDRSGVDKGKTTACSLVCMIQWAYESATINGMRLAYGAKQTFESFMSMLGGKKP